MKKKDVPELGSWERSLPLLSEERGTPELGSWERPLPLLSEEKVAQELKCWVVQSPSHSQVRGEKISPEPAKHLVVRKWSLGDPTNINIVPTK